MTEDGGVETSRGKSADQGTVGLRRGNRYDHFGD